MRRAERRFVKIADLNPNRLFLVPLGAGDAFTRVFYNSSFLLVAKERVILVDCPSPLRRVLHEASRKSHLDIDVPDIGHIVLTHLHGDHCGGMEELGYYKHYVSRQERPHLYLLEELIQPLWENRLKAGMGGSAAAPRMLENFFQPHRWAEGQTFRLANTEPDLEFEVFRTRHSVPCVGLRVRYGMYSIGYSGDGEFDPARIDFLKDCDLIVHECGETPNHTRLEDLKGLPKQLRDKMLLIHVPDDFRYFESDIPVASEGAVYEAGHGREPVVLG